jgi:hypothetical protein
MKQEKNVCAFSATLASTMSMHQLRIQNQAGGAAASASDASALPNFVHGSDSA